MRSLSYAFVAILAFSVAAAQSPTPPAISTRSATPTSTAATSSPAPPTSQQNLLGLWEAKRRFGPDVRGTLIMRGNNDALVAEIAGYSVAVKTTGDAVGFELFDGNNAFEGSFADHRAKIVGHWIQPSGWASTVTLTRFGNSNEWRGFVSPFDETFTLYLATKLRDDGSLGAFLRNPERNVGVNQYAVDRIETDGQIVKLLATPKDNQPARVLARGSYDASTNVLSIVFPTSRLTAFPTSTRVDACRDQNTATIRHLHSMTDGQQRPHK